MNDFTLISVASFIATEIIDGGDTTVIKLTGSDGTEVAAVMPLRVALELVHSFVDDIRTIAAGGQLPAKG